MPQILSVKPIDQEQIKRYLQQYECLQGDQQWIVVFNTRIKQSIGPCYVAQLED